jgi:hypothetical protein
LGINQSQLLVELTATGEVEVDDVPELNQFALIIIHVFDFLTVFDLLLFHTQYSFKILLKRSLVLIVFIEVEDLSKLLLVDAVVPGWCISVVGVTLNLDLLRHGLLQGTIVLSLVVQSDIVVAAHGHGRIQVEILNFHIHFKLKIFV